MGRTWKNCGDELMEILELTSVATLLLFCFVGGGRVVVCAVCGSAVPAWKVSEFGNSQLHFLQVQRAPHTGT